MDKYREDQDTESILIVLYSMTRYSKCSQSTTPHTIVRSSESVHSMAVSTGRSRCAILRKYGGMEQARRSILRTELEPPPQRFTVGAGLAVAL